MDRKINPKINIMIGDVSDPYWGQVMEGIYQGAQRHGFLPTYMLENMFTDPTPQQETDLLRELISQDIDILIHWGTSTEILKVLLNRGIHSIQLTESGINHPNAFSPLGLGDAAALAADHMARQLGGKGSVLMLGEMVRSRRYELGQSRTKGFIRGMAHYPGIHVFHSTCTWFYEDAYKTASQFFDQHPQPIDGIFGLSDTLAMAAHNAARDQGFLTPKTCIIGINGDPFALAAIHHGELSATVETSAVDLGRDAMAVAHQLSQGHQPPNHFPYHIRLVTDKNVEQVSAEKLYQISEMSQRMIALNQSIQEEHSQQLQTNLEITHKVGNILNLRELSAQISKTIAARYGYNVARLYRLDHEQGLLLPMEDPDGSSPRRSTSEDIHLAEAIEQDRIVMVPKTAEKQQSRLLVPIHFSGIITHLLELISPLPLYHNHATLIGLHSLADLLGIAIRNAELYSDATQAREEAVRAEAIAEKADALKSRLLANVSYELRTPLKNIITQSKKAQTTLLTTPQPARNILATNLSEVFRNSEQLIRLINDLLDLSRADINELDLFIRALQPATIIREAFDNIAHSIYSNPRITWKLSLPDPLPVIMADPTRLRQILINLLGNAGKFTQHGTITLGVDYQLPNLHLWIHDTGEGIQSEYQEQIFDPFSGTGSGKNQSKSLGLGLTITRRLVALHGGSISVDSQRGAGSTFHINLPLPTLSGETLPSLAEGYTPGDVLIPSLGNEIAPYLRAFCEDNNLQAIPLKPTQTVLAAPNPARAGAIAWLPSAANRLDWVTLQKLRHNPVTAQYPFLLFLPEATELPDHKTLAPLIDEMTPTEELHNTILLIESDKKVIDKLLAVVSQFHPGYILASTDSIDGAREIIQREPPALVIMALSVQEGAGLNFLDELRANPVTTNTNILVHSLRTLNTEDVKRLDHDKILFITKNILSNQELAERIAFALDGEDLLPRQTSALVKKAIVYIHQNYPRTFTLAQITYEVGVSKSYFSNLFRKEIGLSLWDYLNRFRVLKAKELLRNTTLPINEIAALVGFEDFSYFGRIFNKLCQCSPRVYRKKRTKPA